MKTFTTRNKVREITVTVDEQPEIVRFEITCSIPGDIADGPDYDSLLEETVGAYDDDRRPIAMDFGTRRAMIAWRNGQRVIVFLGVPNPDGEDSADWWKGNHV
jgi:hypothetical protein